MIVFAVKSTMLPDVVRWAIDSDDCDSDTAGEELLSTYEDFQGEHPGAEFRLDESAMDPKCAEFAKVFLSTAQLASRTTFYDVLPVLVALVGVHDMNPVLAAAAIHRCSSEGEDWSDILDAMDEYSGNSVHVCNHDDEAMAARALLSEAWGEWAATKIYYSSEALTIELAKIKADTYFKLWGQHVFVLDKSDYDY